MKLEILQENLNRALNLAIRVVSSKPPTPILTHLLLVAKNNQFTITSSNLETSMIIPVGAKIIKEGEFTVPARPLQEIISSLSAEKISLEVKEGSLFISSVNFTGSLNGTAATEYPQLTASQDSAKTIQPDSNSLLDAISKTVYCAATDEARTVLTGVLFKSTPKGLLFAATDGFRLSVTTLPIGKSQLSEDLSCILPARTLTEVSKIIAEQKDLSQDKEKPTSLYFLPNNQFLFTIDDIKILSHLISGNFPDFEKIIPSESSIKVSLDAQELTKAIRLASVFARDSANIIKINLQNQKLKISANAAQVGENESTLEVQTEKGSAEEFQIAFNYRYILDYLTSLETKAGQVTIDFTTPLAPGLFRTPSDKNYLHLIMPVRVQS